MEAVRLARGVVPSYGRRSPLDSKQVERLSAFARLQVDRAVMGMDAPAVLLPPLAGRYRLVLASDLGPVLTRYVILHEIGHILTGDADEPTLLRAHATLPEAEDVADVFALLGVLDASDFIHGPDWIEERIRLRVPLDDRGWSEERVPRLAHKVWRMKCRALLSDPGGSPSGDR